MQPTFSTKLEVVSTSHRSDVDRGSSRRGHRFVAAFFVLGIGATTHAQDVFGGAADSGSEFTNDLNWVSGSYPGDDFGGNTVDFTFGALPLSPFEIIVGVEVTNLGGLNNTQDDVDVVFNSNSGVGSFSFSDAAVIDPGADGSFTFNLDVIAQGSMTFNLLGNRDVTFNNMFTTNGGTILADGGPLVFSDTSTVESGAGTIWSSENSGDIEFDGGFNATGDQTFNPDSGSITFDGAVTTDGTGTITVNDGRLDFTSNSTVESGDGTRWNVGGADGGFDFAGGFNATGNQTFEGDFAGTGGGVAVDYVFGWRSATFTASADGQFATFDQVTAAFADTVTVDVDAFQDYGFAFNREADVTMTNLSSNAAQLIFNFLDADSKLVIGDGTAGSGAFTVAEDSEMLVRGDGTMEFVDGSSTALLDKFTLKVDDGATIEWFGDISLGDAPGGDAEFDIDTTGGAGNAKIDFQGRITLGDSVESARISVTTDAGGGDTVRFYRDAIRGLDATIVARENSNFTLFDFNSASSGVPVVAAEFETGSTMLLDVSDSPATGDFLLSSIDGGYTSDGDGNPESGDATVTIRYENTSANERDVNLFIRGGTYGGTITQAGQDSNLTVGWAQGESTLVGADMGGTYQVDIGGSYESRNNGVHTVGVDGFTTARIQSYGLNVIQSTMIIENGEFNLRYEDQDGRRGDVLLSSSGTLADALLLMKNASSLTAEGGLDLQSDSTFMMEDDSTATFKRSSTIAGLFSLGKGTAATFTDDLTVSDGGEVLIYGQPLGPGLPGGAGATLTANNVDLEAGSVLQIVGPVDPEQTFAPADLVVTDGNIQVRTGATMIVDGGLDITNGGAAGDLNVSGTLLAGYFNDDSVTVATEGTAFLKQGNLVTNNGTLKFGMSSDTIDPSVTLIDIFTGQADFTGGANLTFDVEGVDYIPTNRKYTIINAGGGIVNASRLTVDPASRSVTRWWDPPSEVGTTIQISSGSDYTLRNTEYQSQYTLESDLLPTAEFLNQSLRPMANRDPTSAAANFLGTLDQFQSLAEYEANLLSTQPTAQASAVQIPVFSQYTTVLRNELQKKSSLVEQRTRAPFRLSDPLDLVANQAEVAERNIRQRTRSATDSRGFGVFWGGEITTPTKGIVEGANGTEWGGLGGFAWDLGESVSAGFNLGYSAFTGNVNDGYGDMRVGTLRLGGFATWTHENFFMDVGIAGGWNHFDVTRNVFSQGGGLGAQTLNSTSDGFLVEGTVGLGYRIPLGESFALTPEGSFLYNFITTGDMDEAGSSSASLKVDPGDINAFTGRVGADLSWSALPGLVFDVAAGWQGTFIQNGGYSSTLTNINVDFPVTVDDETINTAYYGGGVNFDASWNVSLDFRYEGRQGDGLDQNMFFGGVSISF